MRHLFLTQQVTHGMVWPYNLKTALSVEACVRESGAIPATIGSTLILECSFSCTLTRPSSTRRTHSRWPLTCTARAHGGYKEHAVK